MGIGCRVFFVDEDDSLQRISMVRLDRLVRLDPSESFEGTLISVSVVLAIFGGSGETSVSHQEYRLLYASL